MSESIMYPLPFFPIYKDKIWGGEKMRTVLGKDFSPLKNCGEMWLLSGCDNNVSLVSGGRLADNDLNELLEVFLDDFIGEKSFDDENLHFPLLVKIIDSNAWLSIQVHPDDEMAKEQGFANGKTEMWYIVDAEPDAQIIAGFNRPVTLEEYKEHVKNNTLESILNFIPVKKGDTIFIPAGLIHALGPGLLVAEIQQPSDTTYRVYDWNRVDDSGKPRELHIELAEKAIKFDENDCPRIVSHNPVPANKRLPLIECECFDTHLIRLDRNLDFSFESDESFIAFLAVEGSGSVTSNSVTTPIKKGEIVMLPAMLEEFSIVPDGELQLIEMSL